MGMCVSQSGDDRQAGQLRAKWRLRDLESRVTGCLCQQKPHVSLQETGQIFEADASCWAVYSLVSEWLNVKL